MLSWIPFPPPSPGQFVSVPRLSVQPLFTLHTLLWQSHLQAIASTSPCRLRIPKSEAPSQTSYFELPICVFNYALRHLYQRPIVTYKNTRHYNSSFPLPPVNLYHPLVIILPILANDTTYPKTRVTLGFFHLSYLENQISIPPPEYSSPCTPSKSFPMPMISKAFPSLTFITEKIFEQTYA